VPSWTKRTTLPPWRRIGRTSLLLGSATAAWAITDRRRGQSASRRGLSRRLRRSFVALGPTYIKLGQIISSAQGLLPDELVEEFSLVRDRVPAEGIEHVRAVIEQELGAPLERIFSSFDVTPIAAASIAQVHFAVLRSGEPVAVKVQRPDIEHLVERDVRIMAWMAPLLAARIEALQLLNLPALIEVFAETIVEELDFRLEAGNMVDIARVLDETGNTAMLVPRPHPTLVTRRVLVMERLEGFAFGDVAGMRAAGVDTEAVVRALIVSLLEGAMIYGVFHGDLHAGNLLVTDEGRVALLDHGITGRVDEARRGTFLRMMVASMAGDHLAVLRGYQELGALPADTDLAQFLDEVPMDRPRVDPATADADEMLREMRRVTKALVAHGLRLPKEIVLFMKDFVFVDNAIGTLAPDLNILSELAFIAAYFATAHADTISSRLGIDPGTVAFDPAAFLDSVGADPDAGSITHRDLRAQREVARDKLHGRGREGP
jgi:ubiquinone biosynthesis protein